MLAVLAQLGLAAEVGHVGARVGLGDGQADALVAVDDAGEDAVDEGLLAELDQGRAADAQAADDVPHEAAGADARELVRQEHLVEEVPLLGRDTGHAVLGVRRGVVDAQEAGEVAAAAHLLVDGGGHLLLLVPLGHVGLDLIVDPLAHLGAEGGVGLVVVGGVVLREEGGQPIFSFIGFLFFSNLCPPQPWSNGRLRGRREGSQLTLWYQLGSAKGMSEPKGSRASAGADAAAAAAAGAAAFAGAGAGFGAGLGAGAGAGAAAGFFESSEPTWSLGLYFFSTPSLWYFQNILEASLPPTRWRIFLPPVFGVVGG